MSTLSKDRIASIPICSALAVAAGFVWAPVQEVRAAEEGARAAGYIEEIMVTARKREERLQDLPGSNAALGSAYIEDIGGLHSLRDLTDQIIGVTITESRQGNDLAEPSIRGAGQSRNRQAASAVGLYRNGAYFASTSIGGRNFERFDTFDVERVEVLRGPQGALYGRNSLGGAVNMISKKPEDTFDYELTGRAGENDLLGGQIIVNVPLSETFAARLGLVKEEQDDGFYEDIEGETVDRSEHEHVRVSLRAQPSETIDATYSIDYSDEILPIGIQSRREGTVLQLTGGDPFQTTINDRHESLNEVYNHNLLFDYDLPGGTLSSVTNYRVRDVRRYDDFDQSLATAGAATRHVRPYQEVDSDIFFQELRFVSGGGGAWTYLFGADYYTNRTDELIDFFRLDGDVNPNNFVRSVEVEVDSWAVFGSAGYHFEQIPLELAVELRYARDEVTGDMLEAFPLRPGPPADLTHSEEFDNLPWSVTASWRFDNPTVPRLREGMVYAKAASSYRHGGMNLYGGLPTDRYPIKPIYDEETSITYETGFKSGWFDNRVYFNGAAFFQKFDDFLNTTDNGCPEICTYFHPVTNEPLGFDASGNPITVAPDGLEGVESQTFFFIDNVGKVENWGIELELAWQTLIDATGGRLSGNLGWARQLGEVKSIEDDVSPSVLGLEGARQNMLRERQIKSNVIYRQPLGSFLGGGVDLLLSTTYIYERGGIRELETGYPMDTVNRLDARIGLEGQQWSFIVTGTNVLDEEYEIFGDDTRFVVNDPRYVYAEFTWRGFGG